MTDNKIQSETKSFNLQRLSGMIRKESLQIVRDPSSIAIAFVLPVILLLLFGYGVSLDAKQIPIGFVIETSDTQPQSFESLFKHSDYFSPSYYSTIHDAKQAMDKRQISSILWLKNNFTEQLMSGGNAPIELIVNGVDANQARITEGYIQAVWQIWLKNKAIQNKQIMTIPVDMDYRIWFNSALKSRNYLVPGLIAVIMTLIGAMLTAMVVSREWERGTMEAILVTPIHISEFILGKLIPYFILGMGGMLLSVAMAYWLFDVPFRGSFWVLFVASALFMLTCLGMGLLISTTTRSQFVAGEISILVSFLPAFILSGFIFDINSMPTVIQWITYLVPARYYVDIIQSIFLAGNVWSIILINCAYLILMSIIFFTLIVKKSHKRLE
ncbi:ABC transporter permease [sulfur-oxidizing endosymbiont of Gigantopelta aegis]|uniref:ABC transporter permease n=1 Tax=sulfur-oxidizing endosymbiont of Gigantopelta aegis TaxID=2794934 RepID=UPI0018DB64B1|nr:ABC transporter permease [sulfur-oxidizing endosymbiont of Gigantopelta aegis]